MKNVVRPLVLALFSLSFFMTGAAAQDAVVYALPSTSLHLTVTAEREVYTPGPYAKYANKYLGIDVPTEEKESYQLLSITLSPYIEADPSTRIVANLGIFSDEVAKATFMKFSSQGLIVLSDLQKGNPDYWRFPALNDKIAVNAKGATQNFVTAETTLYKNVKNADGVYEKVPVQQSQVVAKSVEKKAQEAAEMIFKLRKNRVAIITGDTDATFSGEALGAAVREMNRLEREYLSLFIGSTRTSKQKMNFDVLPKADQPNQLYIAFRFSDTKGLILADNISGRPIMLELVREAQAVKTEQVVEPVIDNTSKKSSKSQGQVQSFGNISYRIPAICIAKIVDGQELLLQSRIPVYQLGETLTFPLQTIF